MCNYYAAHIQPYFAESVNQPQHIEIVRNPKIAPAFVLLYVVGIYRYDYFSLILELEQHFYLAVRRKTRQDPRCVIVVKKLAPEFKIKLASEILDPVKDFLRLQMKVLVIIKSDPVHFDAPIFNLAGRF
jgi:hypothetical protein